MGNEVIIANSPSQYTQQFKDYMNATGGGYHKDSKYNTEVPIKEGAIPEENTQIIYDFEESYSGDVTATLDLASIYDEYNLKYNTNNTESAKPEKSMKEFLEDKIKETYNLNDTRNYDNTYSSDFTLAVYKLALDLKNKEGDNLYSENEEGKLVVSDIPRDEVPVNLILNAMVKASQDDSEENDKVSATIGLHSYDSWHWRDKDDLDPEYIVSMVMPKEQSESETDNNQNIENNDILKKISDFFSNLFKNLFSANA